MHQVYSFVECEILFIKQKSLIELEEKVVCSMGPIRFGCGTWMEAHLQTFDVLHWFL